MSYILITPIKDEEKNLEDLKETVLDQTFKPLLWVIIDSNSSDNSFDVAKKLTETYDWIHVIKQNELFEKGYGHFNFAEAINEGYLYAKTICEKNHLKFEYVGKIDAALTLSNNYFEVLIDLLKEDETVAFACGTQHLILKDNKELIIKPYKGVKTSGFNDIRLYNNVFFDEMGGYPISYSPDTVLLIKALNNNWNVKLAENAYFMKKRLGGSKIGVWNGYKIKGNSMHYLGYNFTFVMLNAIYHSYKFYPHYQAIPMLYGYMHCFIRKDNKIKDSEIRDYFGRRNVKNVVKLYLS